MENEEREPALSVKKTNDTNFPDQTCAFLNPPKNADLNKETSELCRELKLELEKARRIL